jgi:DNA polymerase-3 subunit delta'
VAVGADGRLALPWIEAPLRQAVQQQRAHALLLQAPDGVGALEFMLSLAQAWLCESESAAPPCGHCLGCRLVHGGTHPDLHLLLPEALRPALGLAVPADDDAGEGAKARRKPSRQIRIDEVRAAIDWVAQSSSRGRAKVVLLHPAEAMNLQAASALLKTLEEPAGQARLLLGTTDESRLLPTVRSRCQRVRLAAPPADVATAWLAGQGVRDAPVLLAAAGGAPLAAVELAAAGIDAAAWQALPRAVSQGQAAALSGWPVPRAVATMQKLCHDALVQALGGTPRYFAAPTLPAGARPEALSAWARSLSRVARHDEHPWNDGLLIEALVSEGRACWQEATTRGPRAARGLATLAR